MIDCLIINILVVTLYSLRNSDYLIIKICIFSISAVQNPLSVLLGLKSIPKIVNGKVIAGDTTSARLTLLKKLPPLDSKPSLNHPDYPELSDQDEDLFEYDWVDNVQNQNFEPTDYSAEDNLFSFPKLEFRHLVRFICAYRVHRNMFLKSYYCKITNDNFSTIIIVENKSRDAI